VQKKKVKVWETTETVTIFSSSEEGTYRIVWHRTDGMPEEEFHVTPAEGDTVEEAVAEDLRSRLGP